MAVRSLNYTKLLQILFVVYAFVIPFSLEMIRIIAPLIILVWFLEGNLKQKFSLIKKEPFFITFGVFLFILTLSLLWTSPENLKFGIKYITRYWYLLPMFALFTSLKKTFVKPLLFAFLAGVLVSVAGSYCVYFQLVPFEKYAYEGASPFMHHTLYSLFLALSIAILTDWLLTAQNLGLRITYSILWLFFTVNLFINIGRAGQLLFFILLMIVLIRRFKVTLFSVIAVLVLLGGIFYAAFTLSPQFKHKMELTQKNLSRIDYNTSLGARIGLDIVAKDIVKQHPLIGVGIGDYLSEKAKTINKKYPDRTYVKFLVHYHNQYAEFAVIAGIFGLFSYLLLLLCIGRLQVRDKHIQTLQYLFLTTFVLSSLVDAMFHLNRPLSLFALFVGIVLAQHRIENLPAIETKTAP